MTSETSSHGGDYGGGRGGGRTAALLLLALAAGVLLAQWLPSDLLGRRSSPSVTAEARSRGDAGHSEEDHQLWTCGMHPQVIQDEPGQCPICGMDLTPLRGSGGGATAAPEIIDVATGRWTCADHPMIVEDAPGTCPIDGLDLVPEMASQAVAPGDAAAPPSLHLDAATVQRMNVRTAKVTRRDMTQPIRTVGYLEFDQQRMVTVTTKYSGWVEKVYVNYVGEKVRQGQPLFEIYSPELVQTEQELLSALKFAEEMRQAPADASQRAFSMVDSARRRLAYWDISPPQIERLEQTGEVFRTLKVTAPADGLVMKRMAGLEGMAVQPGMEIVHLADLSSLWLSVELFEDQVAWVQEGTEASIDLPYFPGQAFQGKVRFIEPDLSEATRTLRAKIEVPNPDGKLRKGMYATVELQPVRLQQVLTIPSQAVLRTGQRQVVVMARGDGEFSPREVVLGLEAEGMAEVLRGLEEGEDIVTSAQFLLDSESQLRQAIQQLVASRGETTPYRDQP